MMAGKNCGNCAAFSALTSECRRKSPVPLPIQKADGSAASLGIYPATGKDGWCLEWQAQEDNSLQ